MKSIILKFLTLINKAIPKNNHYIIFTSYPDMSDNSYAFYEYMLKNHSTKYTFIWLVEPSYSNIDMDYKHTKIISKKSLLGFYYYCLSKYIFFTHGLYNGIQNSKKQTVVNLWHGMPLKNIGYLDNKSEFPKANFSIATSSTFQTIMSKAFNQPLDSVLVTGQPRNQYLLDINNSLLEKFDVHKNDYQKVIAWLPTYRKSNFGDIRNDGTTQELLPMVNKNELLVLDTYFKEQNIFCFIKLHPMDSLSKTDFDTYTHIKILINDDFTKASTQLYSFLAHIDALITDYSSVFIDYMLTKKPIGFVIPDIDSYASNRGFVFDNVLDKLPGTLIQDISELKDFIDTISHSEKTIDYMDNGLFEFYHSIDNDFSEKIYNLVFKGDNI